MGADINVYQKIDNEDISLEVWKNVKIVSDENLKSMGMDSYNRDKRDGINSSVKGDLMKMFKGKSLSQLNLLHAQVTKKITNGVSAGTDVAYWESLAHELKGYRAKVSLQEAHKDLLKRIQEAKKEAEDNPEDKPKPEIKFKAPEAPEYKKKEPPKVKVETRSIQEIEEKKRMKKLEEDCQ